MPAKHPEDLRLVAVAMARMVGPEQAADDLGIDVRTVKSWVAATPPRSDVTDDEAAWQAAEKVALYRNLRALARGEVKDTIRLNNLAGTARDKLFRWATKREAKGESCDCVLPPGWIPSLHPKPGTPEHAAAVWEIAAAKMSPSRRQFMITLRSLIAIYIDSKDDDSWLNIPDAREAIEAIEAALAGVPVPADTDDAVGTLQQWIEGLDDEAVTARQALVDAAYEAYRDALFAELERRADAVPAAAEPARPEPSLSLADDEPLAEPTRLPTARAARAKPEPMVLDVGGSDHDRGWRPWDTRDRW